MTLFRTFLHRMQHLLHWQPIEVVSDWDGNELYVGARCVVCGKESGWHKSRVRRREQPWP